ncbi:hypothetical protein PspLS_10038 [Pyricularia sp. CBS 133598]|nr:hypothetical protein PspLS_10038 [Pyricularia sp. CBS 133598]
MKFTVTTFTIVATSLMTGVMAFKSCQEASTQCIRSCHGSVPAKRSWEQAGIYSAATVQASGAATIMNQN